MLPVTHINLKKGVLTVTELLKVTAWYIAVVVLSSNPLKPRLTTSPLESVIPSCRQVNVVPSTTARPVVDSTWKAVIVVWPAVKMATTVAAVFMVSEKVVGVVAPVWPLREVEEKFIVVLLAAMVRYSIDGCCPMSFNCTSSVLVHCVFEKTKDEQCCPATADFLAIISAIHLHI
jgi:hypothetical protein